MTRSISIACALGLALISASPPAAAQPAGAAKKRKLDLADLAALKDVYDPQISPDGNWVAYTVERQNLADDDGDADVWMTSWDGARSVRLTTSKSSESTPRWSPDGQKLAFISDRDVEWETDQLWVMNTLGGEAEMVTETKGTVEDFDWAPDGKRLVLVIRDPDPGAPENKDDKKTPPPIVIDRFQFKDDDDGYLDGRRRHLYLFELASRKLELLTAGRFNESMPAWSPDGSLIAFVSKRGADFDRDDNWDLFVIEPKVGAKARLLTTYPAADNDPYWESRPAWSPDSKRIAYLQGAAMKLIYYGIHQLAVVSVTGGPAALLAPSADRNMISPQFASDGKAILFMIEDDRTTGLARISADGGPIERLLSEDQDLTSFDMGPDGKVVVLSATKHTPNEVYASEGGKLRPLSKQNDELFAQLVLGAVQETRFKSKDGTEIHGFIVKPPDWKPGKRLPAILRIHGGPALQYSRGFRFDWQLFAAHGYLVIGSNPRGSSGRGQDFSTAIWADWGNKDAQDVLAAVDDAVARGMADPDRLGVGGWSYGGILTNYVIAQDKRFKAAISGSGISNILAGYGTDMYIREYEHELGPPWKNPELWIKLSSPFLRADKIVTPTLFLCGDSDFNVPLLNSEQMYQALRSLGRDTQLIIYPGAHHDISKPSHLRDRFERYLGWYGKYLAAKGKSS